MASIITGPETADAVKSVSEFLEAIKDKNLLKNDPGLFAQTWYRGVNQKFSKQIPRVYRPPFTEAANKQNVHADEENNRLHLECEMMMQFRTVGATFLTGMSEVEIYFYAQHFGMPTRLLDWSTNPLTALFFACSGESEEDGVVYGMDPRKIIPENATQKDAKPLPQAVMTMRHPLVRYAANLSFWAPLEANQKSYILPVRPNVIPGRISQQSSCFTLHMHLAQDRENPTLFTIPVAQGFKVHILKELDYLNVNQFTTYYDLDNLSKQVKSSWKV